MRTLSNACYFLVICFCLSSLAWSQNASGSEDRIAFRARQFRFKLEPGESFRFTLPKVDSLIRIEISRRSADGSISTSLSELMWALPRETRLTRLESVRLSSAFFIPMGGPQAHLNSVESRG